MKERPILFQGAMVRALLDGTKTQTRRVAPIADLNIKHFNGTSVTWGVRFSKPIKGGVLGSYSGRAFTEDQARRIIASEFNPYGQPGDRLWVREAHEFGRSVGDGFLECIYKADGATQIILEPPFTPDLHRGRPSIHMPRWASRITLEITGVRVDRLQDISEEDARAEGLYQDSAGRWTTYSASESAREHLSSVQAYRDLWEQINGLRSWDANPWVWVVELKRI